LTCTGTVLSPSSLDPAVLYSGRFDYLIELPVPSPALRLRILTLSAANGTYSLIDVVLCHSNAVDECSHVDSAADFADSAVAARREDARFHRRRFARRTSRRSDRRRGGQQNCSSLSLSLFLSISALICAH
jgi:ATP-dependent 26S proteasome regulatory subunit